MLVAGVVFQYKGKAIDRPVDSDGVEAEVYLSSGVDDSPIVVADAQSTSNR
jgi:choline dehydrogenase